MEKITKTYRVGPAEQGQRLDKYLAFCLGGAYSRQKIQDYIKSGEVRVDGEVQLLPKFPVQAGNTVVVRVPVIARRLEAEKVAFEVLYRDKDIAIVNKPAGLVVHPEVTGGLLPAGPPTLAHGLLARFPELGGEDNLRPGIVHRLDKDTSGLLLVGLTEAGRSLLEKRFAERAVYKEYLALVHGVPEAPSGEIDYPIGRHPVKKISMAVVADGKDALSFYRVIHASQDGRFSVVAVRIITGRTHQIRVHLSALGHPIIGDCLYGGEGLKVEDELATPLAALKKRKKNEAKEGGALPLAQPLSSTSPLSSSLSASALWPASQPSSSSSSPCSSPSSCLASPAASSVILPLPRPTAGRQMLHAWRLAFPYAPQGVIEQSPFVQATQGELRAGQVTGLVTELAAVCPPPADFMLALKGLLHPPLRVVVTGMPGSGKSSFSQYFEAMGVPVFSADACVRELYGPEGDGTKLLSMRFGDTYINEGGHGQRGGGVNKQALGEAMRQSASLKREIEDMIHPLVYYALEAFWREHATKPVLMAEIPLYFESGALPVDVVVGVACPFAVRAKRLRETRGWEKSVISGMEAWQLPEQEKMTRCDLVVANDGDMADLKKKADETHTLLQARYQERVQQGLEAIVATWEKLPWLER